MTDILLLSDSIWDAQIWYGVPLIIVISLVYGATRHEDLREIAIQCYKSLVWVLGFMGIIFVIIYLAGFFN